MLLAGWGAVGGAPGAGVRGGGIVVTSVACAALGILDDRPQGLARLTVVSAGCRPPGNICSVMKRESWLPATPESVASARAAVLEVGRGVGGLDDGRPVGAHARHSEAVANAIQHGEGCREPGHACDQRGLILLGIEATAEGLAPVEVCDCSRFSAGLQAPTSNQWADAASR